MNEINKMNPLQLIRHFQKMDVTTFKSLLKEKESLLEMNITKFNLLFLNVNHECKKMILDDMDLFNKVMSIPINKLNKSILDLSDDEIRNYIYNHKNLLVSNSGKKVLTHHLRKLNEEELSKLLLNDNLNQVYQMNIQEYILNKYSCSSYVIGTVENAINSNQFKNIALFHIKNEVELLIYAKFQILVRVFKVEKGYLYIDEKKIPYDFIEHVNRRHILSLLELCKTKNDVSNNQLFIGIMKLYMAFGLDNSKKILNDFFTYSTPSSIKRASEELFKDTRREYRLKNQNKYYYYGIEHVFLEAFMNRKLDYFKEFCANNDEEYIFSFWNTLEKRLVGVTKEKRKEIVKKIILEEIEKRENYYHQIDTMKYKKYYESIARKTPITMKDIYNLVSDIDLDYQLTKDGKLKENAIFIKFLLGNSKKDNDCLLRMVLNKQALGLNDELYQIMNHFDKINTLIAKDNELSLYSILDVIDISKVFLYHLKPDELDITLSTLSKLLKSRKYCTELPEVILKRAMKIHKERKKKNSCAIDFYGGIVDEAKYRVANPDEEDLLVSGIDTGSCFKVGGKGEDFFRFCLTNPRGLVLYIEYANIKYVLPGSINGNMLNINSIDPRIEDDALYRKIMSIIEKIAKRIIQDNRNQIEIVTITDIHHETYMKNLNYEKINFERFIPLNTDVYCDYNKSDVSNYILYKKNMDTKIQYYDNKDIFYQSRPNPYIFSPTHEYDKERIELILNNIAYSSIEYISHSEQEKNKHYLYYNKLEVEDFIYIVGSKDWFIGINKKQEIVKYCLPYDKRAMEEFQKYSYLVQDILKNMDKYDLREHHKTK